MSNDFFNHYIFVRTFQWTSSQCLTNFTITVKVAIVTIYIVKWLTKFDVRSIFRDLQTSKTELFVKNSSRLKQLTDFTKNSISEVCRFQLRLCTSSVEQI